MIDSDTTSFWQASSTAASFSLGLSGSEQIDSIRVYADNENNNQITNIIIYDGASFSSIGGMSFGPLGWSELAVGLTGDEIRFSVASNALPMIYEIQICQEDPLPTPTPQFFITSTNTISLMATSIAQQSQIISLQQQILSATVGTASNEASHFAVAFPSGTVSTFSWSLGFGDLLAFGVQAFMFGLGGLYFLVKLTGRL